MKILKKILTAGIILTSLSGFNSFAETIYTKPSDDLNEVINNANQGDHIVLQKGIYYGNFIIEKTLSISCQKGAELNANHQSDTLRIKAADVSIKDCHIKNWGDNLTDMNAGIFVERTATNIHIDNNYLYGDTFGLWLDSAQGAVITNNKIEGNLNIRSQDRGNGIHLFNVTQALVKNNQVWHTRDGIYIDTSNNNQLIGNELHHLRYGIHYMYSYSNLVEDNYTHDTRTGYALMQSKYLTVRNNRSENDTAYGILMNYIVHSTITGNQISNIHQQQGSGGEQVVKGGEGKALFMYNAPFNEVNNNQLSRSDIAIHLTAGSEGNKIYGNYFVNNRRQVKYVANRKVEWSLNKRGNYWSDYQGWDRNADGIGDEPFEPNDGIDKVLWKYPAANILMNSPAIQTLRWVQKEFPVLKSPGIKDSFPLMKNDFSQKNTHSKSVDLAQSH